MNNVGSCIVSWDFSYGKDKGILLVGVKTEGGIPKIVNAFEGQEAEDLYRKLMVRSVVPYADNPK